MPIASSGDRDDPFAIRKQHLRTTAVTAADGAAASETDKEKEPFITSVGGGFLAQDRMTAAPGYTSFFVIMRHQNGARQHKFHS